jgi:hypothetical protein
VGHWQMLGISVHDHRDTSRTGCHTWRALLQKEDVATWRYHRGIFRSRFQLSLLLFLKVGGVQRQSVIRVNEETALYAHHSGLGVVACVKETPFSRPPH